jgi:5,10-methylenetetrahydromethanopterin reductase
VDWPPPFEGGRKALEDEELGFDICYFGDNTCINSDVFAELRDAAQSTKRIKIGTGVTNTVTRDPSTVATSIAAVQVLSGGRAICGVSTGDSAVGLIGRKPQRQAEFADCMHLLKGYLAGESVTRGGVESRIEWLGRFPYTPVPLDIMASAPKTMGTAARFADRITMNIGTAPERVAWALDTIDRGLEEAGRSRSDVQLGLALHVYLHDDRNVAAQRLRPRLGMQAHMQSFPGVDLTAQPAILRDVTTKLRSGYDYAGHYRGAHDVGDSGNSDVVSEEFAHWFGLAGPPSYVIERVHELWSQGFQHFFLPPTRLDEREQFAQKVMDPLRTLLGASSRANVGGR